MSVRALLQNSPRGQGQILGSATTWSDITAGALTLDTLHCVNMYATNIYSGGNDQVPDIYYYGQVALTASFAGNTGGATSNALVSVVTFPEPFYDGPPGDPFAASIQLTLAAQTQSTNGSNVPNQIATQGYLAPYASPLNQFSNAGQLTGVAITVPATLQTGTAVTPISYRGNVHWYAIGVPPQNPPSPWSAITVPQGAYDSGSNESGWVSTSLAGGGGYSTAVLPFYGTVPPVTNGGVVGASSNGILIGPATIPSGGYTSVDGEAADFPIYIRPVAPTIGGLATSPQVPCPTSDAPQSEFWIQAVTIGATPNSVQLGNTVNTAPVPINITQALMLSSQGSDGQTPPYITTTGAGGGYGFRARIFTPSADARNSDGPLYVQLLCGWGLSDPTSNAGISRIALTGWYGNAFFKNAPTTNLTASKYSIVPQVNIFFGSASGEPEGTPPPSTPFSLTGTRWSTNEVASSSPLYETTINVNAPPIVGPQLWYTGNPNFPIKTSTNESGNFASYPNGYYKLPTAGSVAPVSPPSATAGWLNSHMNFTIV